MASRESVDHWAALMWLNDRAGRMALVDLTVDCGSRRASMFNAEDTLSHWRTAAKEVATEVRDRMSEWRDGRGPRGACRRAGSSRDHQFSVVNVSSLP